ncbi:MAG: hypothetical protein QMD53_05620 [Actinomycetota bacterium]|nr:hypothetical protein [Actinomycetota bacterium]
MSDLNKSLEELMAIEGALATAVVDSNSGMVLGKAGTGLDVNLAAAGNSDVLKTKYKVMKLLGLKDNIEDILITLGAQYHILRPLEKKPELFVYIALDKSKANLALARHKVTDIEHTLTI